MFDWDDQELADIIWGEGCQADEKNVRYPEDAEKNDVPDCRETVKRKLTEGITHGEVVREYASTSKSEKNSGFREAMDTQHDLPSFSASQKDRDLRAKKTWLDIGLDISPNQYDDKVLGELVGNSWANIGGFDDLERIFSTDNLDGQTSLGARDDLWSSSKDLISGTSKSSSQALGSTSWDFGALGNTAAQFDINSEYMVDGNRGVHKEDAISSYSRLNFGEVTQQREYSVRKRALNNKQENWSSDQSKTFQRTKLAAGIYDTCPSPAALVPQFDTPQTVQNHPHWSNPYIGNYAYGDFKHSMISDSEKTVKMTPREKIEKLRRRQQMRAMLAIQLQQQQLGNQVPNIDYSLSPKSSQEDQFLNSEDANFEPDEGISKIRCYDPGSSIKKNSTSTISEVDDCSAEDAIVYQLQEVVEKLDLNVRLCIRDSLYRLAQNATQRCYTSDTNSTTTSSHERMAHLEADTNHVDRVLAHLLFHRPFKLSSKDSNTPESSISTKVPTNQKPSCPNNIAMSFLTKGPENEYKD